MIEINLLPVEMRGPEGTPLPRLASILVGAILVTSGGVVIAKYKFEKIPEAKRTIAELKKRKKDIQKKVNEVNKLDKQIKAAKQKVAALNSLEFSRIKWVRLLNEFRKAIPEGCVTRTFKITPAGGSRKVGGYTVGKGYKIEVKLYTTGDDKAACLSMYTKVLDNFKKYLKNSNVVPPAPKGKPKAKYAFYNNFLKLRFGNPSIGAVRLSGPLPRPKGLPSKYRLRMPKNSLDVTVTIPFWLPPS